MCGFAGYLGRSNLPRQAGEAVLEAMGDAIAHRGPDDAGRWLDEQTGIGLVHRRLAIIDTSPAGHQPMASAGGRFVIAYNGEIYNFAALRRELEESGGAPTWRGHSDTEVLLAAIERWGVKEALQRATGMFAFALWDRRDRLLVMARDRMGEKPLYYGWQGRGSDRTFLFGSDLAALREHQSFSSEVDPAAIAELCRLLYIPEPFSVFRGIAKLAPGAILTLTAASGELRQESYFNLIETAASARQHRFDGTPEDAVEALNDILGSAIARQMVSDVPLGAFLSGGIDSSVVVALMQRASSRAVKTFTIGFDEQGFDEAGHARKVAAHLGTEHHELYVGADDALAVIPELPQIYSEPFADSSQVPTFLVSRMARGEVTVALSGDGGDELFGGYNRHLYAQKTWPFIARSPRPLRAAAGRLLHAVSPAAWDRALAPLAKGTVSQLGDKLHKVGDVIGSRSADELYERLIAANPTNDEMLTSQADHTSKAGDAWAPTLAWPAVEQMMARDAAGYLPGDILTKVDRAAMAVSLETRVPMLDPAVVGFAWSLPLDYRIRSGVTKWPLRALLDRYVPRALVERPKMGFALPLGDWLRGPLRDWAEALLEPRELASGGLFRAEAVATLWQHHLSGRRNFEHRIWPVLMTQAWLAKGANARPSLACRSIGAQR